MSRSSTALETDVKRITDVKEDKMEYGSWSAAKSLSAEDGPSTGQETSLT